MKIKIIKCPDDTQWYKKHVGEIFETQARNMAEMRGELNRCGNVIVLDAHGRWNSVKPEDMEVVLR